MQKWHNLGRWMLHISSRIHSRDGNWSFQLHHYSFCLHESLQNKLLPANTLALPTPDNCRQPFKHFHQSAHWLKWVAHNDLDSSCCQLWEDKSVSLLCQWLHRNVWIGMCDNFLTIFTITQKVWNSDLVTFEMYCGSMEKVLFTILCKCATNSVLGTQVERRLWRGCAAVRYNAPQAIELQDPLVWREDHLTPLYPCVNATCACPIRDFKDTGQSIQFTLTIKRNYIVMAYRISLLHWQHHTTFKRDRKQQKRIK